MKEGDLVDQKLRMKPQTRIGKNGLADDLNLSRFQLYRRVKAHAGVSPKQLAGKHRIEQACMLLRETDQSVAAIGAEVGVDDPNYFTRFFKLHTGYSPRAWRKKFSQLVPEPVSTTTPSRPAKSMVATPASTAPIAEPANTALSAPVAVAIKSASAKAEDDMPVHLL